jgi:hypothetical protein
MTGSIYAHLVQSRPDRKHAPFPRLSEADRRTISALRPELYVNTTEHAGEILAQLADGAATPPAGRVYASLVRGNLAFPDPSQLAKDPAARDELWVHSTELTGLPIRRAAPAIRAKTSHNLFRCRTRCGALRVYPRALYVSTIVRRRELRVSRFPTRPPLRTSQRCDQRLLISRVRRWSTGGLNSQPHGCAAIRNVETIKRPCPRQPRAIRNVEHSQP